MRTLILTPAPDFHEDWDWAYDVEAAALTSNGIEVTHRPWTEVGDVAGFDLVMPLVAWGYHLRFAQWLALLDRAEDEHWPLLNLPALLRWNSDKSYLGQLAAAGVPTVASRTVEVLDAASLADAHAAFGDQLVVKPLVSASADDTFRLGPDDAIPAAVAGKRMLVQPFMPAIARSGEVSLMLFGGVVSHCVVKRPKTGDFRVQPHLGGSETPCVPPEGAIPLAHAALAAAPAPATYVRVDMVEAANGQFQIMELELIEPALWLQHAPDKGAAFAAAIKAAA